MLTIELQGPDGRLTRLQVPDEAVIGKGAQNEIRLRNWRVGKEHARLFRTKAGILVEDLGTFSGVGVNGQKISSQHGPLSLDDVIEVGPYKLRLLPETGSTDRAGDQVSEVVQTITQTAIPEEKSRDCVRGLATHQRIRSTAAEDNLNTHLEAELMRDEVLAAGTLAEFSTTTMSDPSSREREFKWRKQIHATLLETMDLRRHDTHGMSDALLRVETEQLIRQIIERIENEIPGDLDRELLCRQVLDEAIGLGPLEILLADDSVTEIMVNRFDEIYVERAGCLQKYPLTFTGDRAVMGVIERIVAPLGRRIDESSPMVDARLKDGSRVNAIIPPLALKGPCLTIRKFSKHKLDAEELIKFQAVSADMAKFLELCVAVRKNIIVSGGTGSGKTTLLNILSNFIPPGERVVTIEDAAELKLHHAHLICLESRPANVEGKGGVPIRDLVRNTLRMRPDRIVVGECRGAEALDMLQAMNTGHEGSLTTLHANSARDALARLETMVLMAGMELPLLAIREQVASAVHIIVQQTRFACGTRKITGISEITGMESGKIQLQELFRFVHEGYSAANGRVVGHFTGCDTVPKFYAELQAVGNNPDLRVFKYSHDRVAMQETAVGFGVRV